MASFLRIPASGGTNAIPAIEYAVKEAARWRDGTDILFMTDGKLVNRKEQTKRLIRQANVILEPFRETGGRFWSLAFGAGCVGWQARMLENFSDGVTTAHSLEANEEFGEMVRRLAQSRFEDQLKTKF